MAATVGEAATVEAAENMATAAVVAAVRAAEAAALLFWLTLEPTQTPALLRSTAEPEERREQGEQARTRALQEAKAQQARLEPSLRRRFRG